MNTAADPQLRRYIDADITWAKILWATDELLADTLHGEPLPTDVIDQIPAGRAQAVVGVCLRAGARLEHGDEALFAKAVADARHRDAGATGWWREALQR